MRSSVFNAVNECDERTDLRATVAAYYAVHACSAGFTNATAVLDRNVGLGPWPFLRGVHPGGNDARCVSEISGGEKIA